MKGSCNRHAYEQHIRPRTTATRRLTALKFKLSGFAGAETNRREPASYDETGQVNFTFSVQFLFGFCRDLAHVA